MVISSLADGLIRRADQVGDLLSGSMFEPTVRLGVTGLARAGKTVFITSLIANLIDRGRMPGLAAAQEGRIEAAFLQPQPDDTVPRFDYENHIAALTGAAPHWPESTRAVSELRLSLRVRPSGLLAGLQGPRTVHLDIVDYPGEWLLDLALLDKSYAAWSEDTLKRVAPRTEAAAFLALAGAEDATQPLDEPRAQALAQSFTAYLEAARAAGRADLTPGRFLLPGDLAGSPVLTFAPLPPQSGAPRRSLWREMERRFEVYKSRVVQPFFRDHFARIDRQVVLVDLLGALHRGPAAVADTRKVLAEILGAFRPGRNAFLSRLLRGRRVEKILFAATKADHLHHTQHPRLTALMETLVRDATERARFAGAETAALSLAALRATTEETRTHDGQELHMVRGRLLDSGKAAAFYPGELPESPSALFDSGRTGWLDESFEAMSFAPAALTLRPGEGPPHIRLDRAAQFLIGDRL
ncbi:YcjX family GTP-binding protein [Albibacillus kandeliae]|uniref:YcjX family protein n=1 Tax=Albibacillus kandeliae TaxID=2174228 RepID=UPI000D6876AC|nr:YcjX family protein [Albibacillus kandeliae]